MHFAIFSNAFSVLKCLHAKFFTVELYLFLVFFWKLQTPENIRPTRNRRRGKLIVFHITLIPVHQRCGNCTLLIFVGSRSVFPFWCFCLFCSSFFFFFFFAQMSWNYYSRRFWLSFPRVTLLLLAAAHGATCGPTQTSYRSLTPSSLPTTPPPPVAAAVAATLRTFSLKSSRRAGLVSLIISHLSKACIPSRSVFSRMD